MFIIFISLVLSADIDITICYRNCPASIKGEEIIVFNADDISAKIKNYLSDAKTNIYFYNASKFIFSFDLKIFRGHVVEFRKLVDTNSVLLEIDSTDSEKMSESLIFKNVDVLFCSSLKSPELKVGSLEIEQAKINLYLIDSKLISEKVITDKSIQVFNSIDIVNNNTISNPELQLIANSNSKLSIQVIDNGAILTNDEVTIAISFSENHPTKLFNLFDATFCEIECKCSEISKIIQFSFSNMNNLHFSGNWPKAAVFDVTSFDPIKLVSNSTVLPVSLVSSNQAIITVTQSETTITGDVYSSIVFTNDEESNQNRKTVIFEKIFEGSSLDLGSSFYDITLSDLTTDISGSGMLPFIFRIGEGGISTLTVLNSPQLATAGKTGVTIYPDFDSALPDDKLSNLLAKKWTILTLAGVTFPSNEIRVEMRNEPFIHGFVKGDSCFTCKIEDNSVTLSATSPSLLPLNVCYGDCSSIDAIKIDTIDSLSSYVSKGVNRLHLHIEASQLQLVDLSEFDLAEATITGYNGCSLNSIRMSDKPRVSRIALDGLNLGTTVFSAKEISFSGCKAQESSTFTLNNCDKIECDDDFILHILPHISSSTTVKTVTYQMEKFNSVTISDDKFVLHELNSNDSRNPSELKREFVGFLDIVYDVGKRQGYDNNNLNLTMSTKNPPSFNVSFVNQQSSSISSVPELLLLSWSQTKEADFKCYFMFNHIDSKIVLTSGYRPQQLVPVGTGILSYETSYENSPRLCSTLESDKGLCPEDSQHVSFDKLNDKLRDSNDEIISVYIKSQRDNCPSIDLANVNEKVSLFTGLSNDLSDYIEISSSQSPNMESTETTFKHLIVKKATAQTSQLALANVEIYDSKVDSSFNDVELKAHDLYCEYQILSSFDSLSISNDLILNGSLSSEKATVNSNRLTATIESDCSLLLGEKSVSIGETKFLFSSTKDDYNAVFDFGQNVKNVNINKDNDASLSTIPKIEIRKSSNAMFTFSNNWKSEASRSSIILFTHLSNNKIYLTGENTPASFVSNGDISLISKGENVGIDGYIEMQSPSSINVQYEGTAKSKISVTQRITIGNDINIKFSQPSIEFDVFGIESKSDESPKFVGTELFSNLEGDSLFVVQKAMKNAKISPDYKIEIPITADVSDNKLASYYSSKHLLMKVNPADAKSATPKSIELIGKLPTSQGITKDNIDINVDESTGEISLRLKKNPLEKTTTFCYETSNDGICQHKITDENIDNLESLLPSGPGVLKFIFGKENNKVLNLGIEKIKGSTVIIEQESDGQLSVQLNLGEGVISTLSLNKVFGVSTSSTFMIDRIELQNGAKFNEIKKIGIINIDYKSVWKESPIEPCDNHIILNLTGSSLLFTNSGFVVDSDSEIQFSSYPNLAFQLTESSTPTKLEASEDMTDLREVTIYSETNKFVLGSNWASSSGAPKINIVFGNDVKLNELFVKTSSYPFVQLPQLMQAETIQIEKSVLPYKVPLPTVTFDNINSKLDFSHVKNEPEKVKVTFESLVLHGSSSLSVKEISSLKYLNDNGGYAISIQKVEIQDGSAVTLNNVIIHDSLEINGNSSLKGRYDVSKIAMKWKLNRIPKIELDENSNKVIEKIEFIFDDPDFKEGDENSYNRYLSGKSFEIVKSHSISKCNNLKAVFKFVSQKVPSFGHESIFNVNCNNGNLVIVGARKVEAPVDKNEKLKKYLLIVVVAFDAILFIIICALLVILCIRGRQNPNEEPSLNMISHSNLLLA